MSFYEALKDFMGPAATVIAAVSATTVTGIFAYQQSKTAKLQAKISLDKLKLDAIADRIDVLNATTDLITYVVNLHPDREVDSSKIQSLRYRTLKGRFLFKESIYVEIEKTVDKCLSVPMYIPRPPGKLQDWYKELVRESGAAKVYVIKIRDKLPIILEKEISLDLFKDAPTERFLKLDIFMMTIYILLVVQFVTILALFVAAILSTF